MNLFRSEEHVKNWSQYDAVSAQSIMTLANWAEVFSGPLCKNRLQPDYLSRVNEYAGELLATLKRLGKEGPFWTPQ
ncbi:hypothetical protein [Geomonas sp.]|uniref:hypothetical protein n=1 Tax=Geomonas sp. TaxID=2651584 RepID=UPI002B49E3FB|nr:hypothetical protein [Geomonas sp.]HJV36251.1 hypothetical protein [Geomonas sp.]